MVVRKLLTLIIVLYSYTVFSQEVPSFVPSHPVNNLYIVVEDEDFTFPIPPMFKAIITVEADSTVSYVNILNKEYSDKEDWKTEIMTWKFYPAMQDSVQVQSNELFEIQLLSKKEEIKEKSKVGFKLNETKARIVEFANKDIRNYYDNLSLLNPGVYVSNLHFASPLINEMIITEDSFTTLSDITTPLFRFKTGFSGTRLKRVGDYYEQNQPYYPYQPALTTIYAGMGENDHNIAVIGFMKNNILDIKDLYVRADMHFEYGFWGNAIETTGNNKFTVGYKSKIGDVTLKYKRLNQEIPSINIMPVYKLGTYDVTSQRGYVMSSVFKSKYFLLGYQETNKKFKILEEDGSKFKDVSKQYLTGIKYEHDALASSLNYEYVDRKTNYDVVELYQDSPDSKHILSFKSIVNTKYLKYERILLYKMEPKQLNYQNELHLPIAKWLQLRGEYTYRERDRHETSVGVDSLNYKESFEDYTEAYNKQKWGGGLAFNFPMLSIEALSGMKKTYNFQQDQIGEEVEIKEFDREDLYISLKASLRWKLNDVDFTLSNNTNYQKKINELFYYPEIQSRTSMQARKQLEHDNALKTGVNSVYISGYLSERGVTSEYLIVDWYFGFEISKLFELRGYIKNVLNELDILRRDLIPRTYMATMQWNFIN